MAPIGRRDLMQDVLVRQNIDRSQSTLCTDLSEGVKQHFATRFEPRNGAAVLARSRASRDRNPPGLRAITIAPPAHKTEYLPRIKEMQRPAFMQRISHHRPPEKQPVTRALLHHPKAQTGSGNGDDARAVHPRSRAIAGPVAVGFDACVFEGDEFFA